MISKRSLCFALLAISLLTVGCRHRCCFRRDPGVIPPPSIGIAPSTSGTAPFLGPSTIPPTNIQERSNFNRRTPEILLPQQSPQSLPSRMPSSGNNITLLKPEVTPSISNKDSTNSAPAAPSASMFPSPPDKFSVFPVGIADYAVVKEKVSTGLRPDLDGLSWLEQQKYKTVLYLRKPTDKDESHRRQVEEKRGITFRSLSISPEAINTETLSEFNKVVSDSSGYPLFVYDLDSSLAGVMWYLHFRSAEYLSHDQAKLRAGRLGLKPDQSPEHRAMWEAAQNLMKSMQKD